MTKIVIISDTRQSKNDLQQWKTNGENQGLAGWVITAQGVHISPPFTELSTIIGTPSKKFFYFFVYFV